MYYNNFFVKLDENHNRRCINIKYLTEKLEKGLASKADLIIFGVKQKTEYI